MSARRYDYTVVEDNGGGLHLFLFEPGIDTPSARDLRTSSLSLVLWQSRLTALTQVTTLAAGKGKCMTLKRSGIFSSRMNMVTGLSPIARVTGA
jgi:hypothetical protein